MKTKSKAAFLLLVLLTFFLIGSCNKPTNPNMVATPFFNPPGGTYESPQTVNIECATLGVTIYYTLDGTEPISSSPIYTKPITIDETTTIKAKAFRSGMQDSKTATAKYVIDLRVAKPIFNVPSGTYESVQEISISCVTPGAEIFYTTDGTEPSENSEVYVRPIYIGTNTTIKAKGYKTGWAPSATAKATYTINLPPFSENFVLVQGGTIYPESGHYTDGLTVSDFYICKYQLTQAEYAVVMGHNPSWFYGNPNHPVEEVTWFDAIEYCNRRSIQEGLPPCYSYSSYGTNPANWPAGWNTSSGNAVNVNCDWSAIGYRLPSEAEWEYAARGGLQTHGYTYSGSGTVGDVAWHSGNSGNTTHEVGSKLPNELGIYDMSGNVWEWCWDIYIGTDRVVRGGSWDSYAYYCTVSYRDSYYASDGYSNLGFRVCRVSP